MGSLRCGRRQASLEFVDVQAPSGRFVEVVTHAHAVIERNAGRVQRVLRHLRSKEEQPEVATARTM